MNSVPCHIEVNEDFLSKSMRCHSPVLAVLSLTLDNLCLSSHSCFSLFYLEIFCSALLLVLGLGLAYLTYIRLYIKAIRRFHSIEGESLIRVWVRRILRFGKHVCVARAHLKIIKMRTFCTHIDIF